MAKVPGSTALGNVTPGVGPTVFQTFRATPAAFGAQIAQETQRSGAGAAKLGGDILGIGLRIQLEENQRELKEALTELSRQKNGIGFGDGTSANPGFYSLEGEEALQASGKTREGLLSAQTEIGKGLSNRKVKQLFAAASAQDITNELARYNSHTAKQRKVANARTADARQNEAIDDAALNYADNDIVNKNIFIAIAEATAAATERGFGPEAISSFAEQAGSKVAVASITAAVKAGDAARAQELFDTFTEKQENGKAVLDGRDIPAMAKLVEDADIRAQAQEATDGIIDADLGEAQSLEAARMIEDPKVRDDVVRRLNLRFAENAREVRRTLAKTSGDAFRHVIAGGTMSDLAQSDPVAFDTIASDGNLMSALLAAEKRVALGQRFARITDGKTLRTLQEMEVQDQATFNVDTIQGMLTQSEESTAVRIVQSAQDKMQGASENQAIYNASEGVLKDFAPKSLKWGRSGKGGASANQFKQQQTAKTQMRLFVDDFVQQGKKPTRAELEQEAIRLLLKVEADPTGLFNSFEGIGAQFRELTPEQLAVATVDIDDIPSETLTDIKLSIINRGLVATTNLVEALAGALATNNRQRALTLLNINVPQQQAPSVAPQDTGSLGAGGGS